MTDVYIHCIKEYIRVSELCKEHNEKNNTSIKPWELVSYNGIRDKFSNHPAFLSSQDLSKYEFAVDILEGIPVFIGDTLYFKANGRTFMWGTRFNPQFNSEEFTKYKEGLSWKLDEDILIPMKQTELEYIVKILGECSEHYDLWERLSEIYRSNH